MVPFEYSGEYVVLITTLYSTGALLLLFFVTYKVKKRTNKLKTRKKEILLIVADMDSVLVIRFSFFLFIKTLNIRKLGKKKITRTGSRTRVKGVEDPHSTAELFALRIV